MIRGIVNHDRVPVISLTIANRDFFALVDTGFNGSLELPADLMPLLSASRLGTAISELAGGRRVSEDLYLVSLEFDGVPCQVSATFSQDAGVLIGTELLSKHRLCVDFVNRQVEIHQINPSS
ncbi:hypothetical protein GC163_04365 [bacterium]|nr:hypothetical protein [bacterium]